MIIVKGIGPLVKDEGYLLEKEEVGGDNHNPQLPAMVLIIRSF